MSRIFARFAFGVALTVALAFSTVVASAQQNRSDLNAYNNANIDANGVGAITGPILNVDIANLITSMGVQADNNIWSGTNTYQINPTLTACLGFAYGNNSAPVTCQALITGAQLAPGAAAFNLGSSRAVSVKVSSYQVIASDCGTLIQMGAGTTGPLTLTFPSSLGGFPAACYVDIANGDAARLKSVANVSGISWLYPTQFAGISHVSLDGTAWVASNAPTRYRPNYNPTYIVDNAVGSDSNDCLGAGAGSACATYNGAFNAACNTLDSGGYYPTLQGTLGQSNTVPFNLQSGGLGGATNANFIQQPYCVGFNQFYIDLAGSNLATSNSNAIIIRGVPIWLALKNSAGLGTGGIITAGNANDAECYGGGSTIEIADGNVTWGAVGSSFAQISLTRRCRLVTRANPCPSPTTTAGCANSIQMNFNGGGGASAIQTIIGGSAEIEAPVVFTGAPTYQKAVFQSAQDSLLAFGHNTPLIGTVHGPQWEIEKGGVIDSNLNYGSNTLCSTNQTSISLVGCNSYFPGNALGYFGIGGGVMDNPGSPYIVSGCGAGATMNGGATDRSGFVVLGTTPTATCTIQDVTLTGLTCTGNTNNTGLAGYPAVTPPSGQGPGDTPGTMVVTTNSPYSGEAVFYHCDELQH